MREIPAELITHAVQAMCVETNCCLPKDVQNAILQARRQEDWADALEILDRLIENYTIAEKNRQPVCQDTGLACVFLEIGQDVHVQGSIRDAVDEGVRRGYCEGYLRKSCVNDPLFRKNTGDNTPAMLYETLVEGDHIKITVAPKGFGSENMSRIKMLRPSDGVEGVKAFVLDTIERAGSNPCPPVVVGVGLGGTFDKAALLAKQALLRPLNQRSVDAYYARLEQDLLEQINSKGIGPQGYGGHTTALAVNIERMPTHIAGLPCAVNLNCHVTRHQTVVL